VVRMIYRHFVIFRTRVKPVSRIQLHRSGVPVGAALGRPLPGLLRVGLDDAASPPDLFKCRRDRRDGDALAAVRRIGEGAADPPVRQIVGSLVVGAPVLDVGEPSVGDLSQRPPGAVADDVLGDVGLDWFLRSAAVAG